MTEIRFYHLQKQSLDQALPLIVEKAYQSGRKIVIRLSSEKEAERISALLWAYKPDSFLPHGTKKNGQAGSHPIWITHLEENPNDAKVLIYAQDVQPENLEAYDLCCDMLDGRSDKAVKEARVRWKTYQAADYDLTYWLQNEKGGWEKKAA